jgi:hypothetical protein
MNCKRCAGEMREGVAIAPTWVLGLPDFPGDPPFSPGQTVTFGGPGKLIACLKCKECGYSTSKGAENV